MAAIADPRLVWMQGQAIGRDPHLDLAQGGQGLRLRPAQDHEIIGVPHHPPSALCHQDIGRVQIKVGQQRRDHRPLGRSRRRLREDRAPARHVDHDILPEEAFDERQDCPLAERTCHQGYQPVVRDAGSRPAPG
ncbi:MAG TPA: hypothetical protein VE687_19350 [Stellaceae bacterium]|nr:hypothetical protein [Stellaceae bacterium]